MRILFLFLLLSFISGPVFAQDNVIRVIREDGSVVEFDAPERAYETPVPSSPRKGAPPMKAAPEPAPVKAMPALPPPTPRKKAAAPVIEEDAEEEFAPLVEPHPQLENVETITEAVYEDEYEYYAPEPPPAHVPRHKPVIRETGPAPGQEISSRQALAIALEDAPPASNVSVARRTFEGYPAWLVQFRTTEGAHDVLVDSRTGEILLSESFRAKLPLVIPGTPRE